MTTSHTLLWTQPDWLETAGTWIDTTLDQQGIRVNGPLDQFHVRPWSTVIRVPTVGGDIYFKAVAPALVQEAALTQALAQWHPACMPHVVAADAERGWMLVADGGRRLRSLLTSEGDIRHWEALLPTYAELQIQLSKRVDELLALGAPDRRLSTLPTTFDRLLDSTDILRLARAGDLTPSEHRRLRDAAGTFARLCEELSAYSVPESLDHGDFHDGNIFVQNGRYLFFDWGDSGITHPFFSMRTVFVSLENTFGLEEGGPWATRLRDCYLEPWSAYATEERLVAAFAVSEGLAPIISVLRWLPALSTLDDPTQSDYADAISQLLRELLSLLEDE